MDINLRYIAVSATVPNLQDIATWLSAKRKCIHNYFVHTRQLSFAFSIFDQAFYHHIYVAISFSEEYRPIKLDRFVYGYSQSESNMFLFDKKLNWKYVYIVM